MEPQPHDEWAQEDVLLYRMKALLDWHLYKRSTRMADSMRVNGSYTTSAERHKRATLVLKDLQRYLKNQEGKMERRTA